MANSSVSPTPPTNEPDHTGHSTDSHHLDHFHNALSSTTPNAHWQPDMLGPDYESMSFALGTDPDGETDIYTTLVRYTPSVQGAQSNQGVQKAETSESTPTGNNNPAPDGHNQPAILLIHGMSDYFFQTHVAEFFANQGYAFYAIDLRKCGRSYRPGQSWHYITSITEYFTDLTTVMEYLATIHQQIIIIAHSTGGLIAPLWLDNIKTHNPQLHQHMTALVLNSPWLDMMVPAWMSLGLTPVVNVIGKRRPHTAIPGVTLSTYGKTIHASVGGEWEFDTTMKPLYGHKKYVGWLRAIKQGQQQIHSGQVDAGVPTLVLSSHKSILGKSYSPDRSHSADTLLDVEQIHKWAPRVAAHVTAIRVYGAIHDVFLSRKPIRRQAFAMCAAWLDSVVYPPMTESDDVE